jgi:hypothetical protein
MRYRDSLPRRLHRWSEAPAGGRSFSHGDGHYVLGVRGVGPVPTWGRSTRLGKWATAPVETRNANSMGTGTETRHYDRTTRLHWTGVIFF